MRQILKGLKTTWRDLLQKCRGKQNYFMRIMKIARQIVHCDLPVSLSRALLVSLPISGMARFTLIQCISIRLISVLKLISIPVTLFVHSDIFFKNTRWEERGRRLKVK